jgi:hypothetical protein
MYDKVAPGSRRRRMKTRVLFVVGMVVALCALAVMPAFSQGPDIEDRIESILADASVANWDVCDPTYRECSYARTTDNLDNALNPVSDQDMGLDTPPTMVYRTCQSDAKHPIEFDIVASSIDYTTDAVFYMVAMGTSARWPDFSLVQLNGVNWAPEVERVGDEYVLWVGHIDPSLVQVGNNRVQIYLRSGRCVRLMMGVIEVMDEPVVFEGDFVPEAGSMLLLGSGLAGLAGYAGLRLRSRKS